MNILFYSLFYLIYISKVLLNNQHNELLDNKKNVYYTVYYKNKEGFEFPFALYYDPAGGGKIRLKNQKTIVWTRVPKS